ncbi:MAG TPA: phosphate ABC transporter permease PstA [Fimbriimonadaceae bacterium]|nr:phosphate ABC transporter permease PstA [Fimbriimonadaceae bacterium]
MAALGLDDANLLERDLKRQRSSQLFSVRLLICALISIGVVIGIIGTILVKGVPAINWEFLSHAPAEGMSAGGIWPMIRGSILLMAGTLLITPAVGILGGIWLAEYAGNGRLPQVVRACISTLAATPSIIYGLFGLAIFVLKWKLGTSLVAGWLTLSLMSIPVVMLTTERAIRSVPPTFLEGAVSLGLSKWQALRRAVLPSAVPGIITGLVLAAGRAVGEAPPILLTAGLYFSTEKLTLDFDTLSKPVANLPYHLAEGYRQGGVIPEKIIWGTCLTLMMFVLLINLGAIIVRSRQRAKQRW